MSYKIAIASSDGEQIDLGFGQCDSFTVLEVADDGSILETSLRSMGDIPEESIRHEYENLACGGKVLYKVEQLVDCDAVLCKEIGFQARKNLNSRGISVFDIGGTMTERLPRILSYLLKQKNPLDVVIPRCGTDSLKYDFVRERTGRDDLLPLWVADMDFALPGDILDELKQRVAHGIFGYTDPKKDYGNALKAWYLQHHRWELSPEWNTITPGVVYGLAQAILAFTNPGDAVLIQQPVYYPFSEVIQQNQRVLINNELSFDGSRYTMDFSDLEEQIKTNHVKMMILCNPHNPVGRVWTKEELLYVDQITRKYDVLVFADEIHGDFVYPGHTYIPFASLSEKAANHTIVGTSASKTFNIAGLQVSNILIPNPVLRRTYRKQISASGYSQGNTMGLLATRLVYERGGDWYKSVLSYLQGNLSYIRDYLEAYLPQVKLIEPEGTYLIWLDFSGVHQSPEVVEDLIRNRAHLFLDSGRIFGPKSAFFHRLNIACPRSILQQAMEQLYDAIWNLN